MLYKQNNTKQQKVSRVSNISSCYQLIFMNDKVMFQWAPLILYVWNIGRFIFIEVLRWFEQSFILNKVPDVPKFWSSTSAQWSSTSLFLITYYSLYDVTIVLIEHKFDCLCTTQTIKTTQCVVISVSSVNCHLSDREKDLVLLK